jgi:hypothetical protein
MVSHGLGITAAKTSRGSCKLTGEVSVRFGCDGGFIVRL